MNENQTSEPQHNTALIGIRVLSAADAKSYQSVRLLALHEHPPLSAHCQRMNPTLLKLLQDLLRVAIAAFSEPSKTIN